MGSDRLHISLQTVGRVDSFREINGAAVHDIRHTLPLLTLNNDSINQSVSPTFAEADSLCNCRANLQGRKVQISPVGGSGRTLSCVLASLLGWWKQIDRMQFHDLTSEVPRSLF